MGLVNQRKALGLAVAISIALSGCSDNKSPEEYLLAAKSSFQNNNPSDAVIHLKNLLKVDAKNAEARFLLGKHFADAGQWLNAEKELSKALGYGFDKDATATVLSKVYYQLREADEIESLLEKVNVDVKPESRIIIRTNLALAYASQGETDVAKKILATIAIANDKSPYVKLSQAWLKAADKDYQGAVNLLNQIIELDSSFTPAYEYKGNMLFATGDMQGAATAYGHFVEAHPQAHKTRMMYSLALVNAENYVEAENQAGRLLQLFPNQPLVNQIKAQARFYEKDYENAKLFADVANNAGALMPISRIIAGMSAYQLGNLEVAYQNLLTVQKQLTLKHPASKLLNAIRLQLGYTEEVYDDILSNSLEDLDSALLTATAKELFKIGETSKADEMLEKASLIEPDNADIVFQQGVLKLLSDDAGSDEFFKSALDANPESDAALSMLIVSYVKAGKYDQAFEQVNKIKNKSPSLGWLMEGAIYKQQRKFDEAKNAYQKALTFDGGNYKALFNLAEIADSEGLYQQATDYLIQALEEKPNHLKAVIVLLRYSKRDELKPSIEKYFVERYNQDNTDVLSVLALAEYYAIHENFEKSDAILSVAVKMYSEENRLLLLQAKVAARLKQNARSIEILDGIIAREPRNIIAIKTKANVLRYLGDTAGTIRELLQAIELSPNDESLVIELAQMHIQNAEAYRAKQVLDKLPKHKREALEVQRLYGRIAFIEEDYKKATSVLTSVYKAKKSESVVLELVQSMQNAEQYKEALELIRDFEKNTDNVSSIKLSLKEAELYEKIDIDKSIATYQDLATKTKNHYVILNNIAWLQLVKGNKEEALRVAEQAYTKKPNLAEVQHTYGLALLANGDSATSVMVLEKAYNANKMKDTYKLHYAQALLANNNAGKARSLFKEISFGQLTKQDKLDYETLKKALL